jgi:hypothetical protein
VAAFHAPGAFAGPLEGVTGPVTEAVVEPVREATGAVTPPVQEVTEAVTQPVHEANEAVAPPVHEVTERVAPPVKEATETGTHSAKEVTEAVKSPLKVHLPTETSGSSSAGAVKTARGVVEEVTGTATHAAEDTIGGVVTGATGSGRSSAGRGGDTDGGDRGAANDVIPSRQPGSSHAVSGSGDLFEVPSIEGSIGTPLPKWIAYVWPAIALLGPGPADLLGRWEREILHLAYGRSTGSGDGPVVAGVHASGGQPGGGDPSSSPFSKIPPLLGHPFGSDVPTSALVYLLLVTLAVIAVAVAVRRELRHGGRE